MRAGTHPLLGARIAAAGSPRFEALVSPDALWALREHRVAGRPVLPGTAYLEMARAAMACVEADAASLRATRAPRAAEGQDGAAWLVVRDWAWEAAMVFADAPRHVRLTLDAEFPAEVHLVRGTFAGPLEQRSIDFGGRGVPFAVDACLDGGPWYAVVTLGMACGPIRDGEPCTIPDPAHPPPPDDPPVVPGYDGNAYCLRLECLSCGVFGDLNGDGRVDGGDLGLILGAWSVN